MSQEKVKKFYTRYGIKEWQRFESQLERFEYETTVHFLQKYLKKKKGTILDAGGGPGRYSILLAKLGFDVTLLDLTPKLLQIAKENIKKENVENKVKIIEGSITDLSNFPDKSFDTVVCLGAPLNHTTNVKERKKAIAEMIRVTKKNGFIFVSVISKLGVLIDPFLRQNYDFNKWEKVLKTGDFSGRGFAPCHFYTVDEFKKDFSKRNIKLLELVGLQGLASLKYSVNKWNKKIWNDWWKLHLKTCTQPAVVETSSHFLGVFKKN